MVPVATSPRVELVVAERPGQGTPLLVIHGGPDWDHTYLLDPLIRLDARVLFVDIRGCGRSTRGLGDEAYSPAAVTQDLVALLDALEVPRADVLGFSYGGLLAQRLAIAAPTRVSHLVIASSGVFPVPVDAFDGWEEREQRISEQTDVPHDDAPMTAQVVREMALATVPTNVWNRDLWPAYRERLDAVRFSAEWAKAWVAGTLPTPRLLGGVEALAQLTCQIL